MSKDNTPPSDDDTLNILDLTSKGSVEDFIETEPIKVDEDILAFLKRLNKEFPETNILDVVKAYKAAEQSATMANILSQLGIVQIDG